MVAGTAILYGKSRRPQILAGGGLLIFYKTLFLYFDGVMPTYFLKILIK